nr:putative capsid protein [Picobirnavirus sp.]
MSKTKYSEGDKGGNKRRKERDEVIRSKSAPSARNERRKCDIDRSGDINDASYYFLNDDLKRQVTNISFNQFNGVSNDLGYALDENGVLQPVYDGVPYIMRIVTSPSAGYTFGDDYTALGNGVNLAALNLYTLLSSNNAKTTNYAPQDLTTLLLALGSFIELTSYVTRFFGMTSLYNYRNRAFPKAMIEAAGCDYDDLMSSLADYRVRFNNILVSAAKIPIPQNIPYFKKCSEMYQGLYQDMVGSSMAQLYILVPGTVWRLEEQYSSDGTGLSTLRVMQGTTVEAPVLTMSDLLERLEDMLGALLNSSTLNAIYSDILRVATKENIPLMQFSMVDESYVILPNYVPEIRLWINNLTIMGYPATAGPEGFTYTRDNDVVPSAEYNRIKYAPIFEFATGTPMLNQYINFDYENPDANDIVYSMKLKTGIQLQKEGTRFWTTAVALPDHYVNELWVYRSSGWVQIIKSSFDVSSGDVEVCSAFDWYPIFYNRYGSSFTSIGDLNFYTTVDFNYLKRLHDTEYLGLLTIR